MNPTPARTTRRNFLTTSTAAGLALASATPASAAEGTSDQAESKPLPKRYQNGTSPWPICLDSATLRSTPLRKKIQIAAKAGYDAFEPWSQDLEEFEKQGGNCKDLGKEIRDLGLFVPSMIGLWKVIPTDPAKFDEALKENRPRMRMAAEVGAEHVQVIPAFEGDMDLKWAAQAYRKVLEIGLEDYGLNPAMVFVAYFPVARLGQAAAIALDADHPKAKIIPDAFHMYISDGGFHCLKHLRGEFLAIFQINDAPATPSKENLRDKHRVYPGDGILPLEQVIRDLQTINFNRCISLELYNQDYWKQDPLEVAKTGLEKTLGVISRGLG